MRLKIEMVVTTIFALSVVGCGDAPSNEPEYPSVPPPIISIPETESTSQPLQFEPASSIASTPNFDDRDGDTYFYIAEVSEEERMRGRAVGNVHSFQFLGRNSEGEYVLASLHGNGAIAYRAKCRRPCRIIDTSYGQKIAYSPESIIGAAFQDAMRGDLQIADWAAAEAKANSSEQARREAPLSQAGSPTPQSTTEPDSAGTDLETLTSENFDEHVGLSDPELEIP